MSRRAGLVSLVLAACVGDQSVASLTPDAGNTPDTGTSADSGAPMDSGTPAPSDGGTEAGACLPPAPNMISWWTGDDSYADHLGQNDMTQVLDGGVISFAPAEVGNGFLFDRTARLERAAPFGLNNLTGFSVEAWVKRAGSETERFLERTTAGVNDGWLFDVWMTKLRFDIGVNGVESKTPMPFGVMTHVAGTFDGQTFRLYINGVEDNVNVLESAATVPSPALPLRIGGDSKGTSLFGGLLDEMAMYSRALTPAEVKAIFMAGPNGRCK